MAELILTEEEKKAKTYLEWDDEALGRMVKKAAKLISDYRGEDSITMVSAATLLVSSAHKVNSSDSTWTLEGVTVPEDIGDWEITVRRLGL